MGPDRDRTRDPWICSQTRICCQTRYRLRYAARRKIKKKVHSVLPILYGNVQGCVPVSLNWTDYTNSYTPPLKRTENMPKFHLITEKHSKNIRLTVLSKNAAAFSTRTSRSSRENSMKMST